MGISPEETAKHRRLLMTMLTDSTAGNTKNVDLSVYNHIVLEIEATDSRVEIYVLYEGLEKSTCIGGIDAGKTKAVCELEHIDKVQAIYIAKSKVGITKIVKFVLTDEID